jgi:drug/metabolite transporter (DMT)-like permease
VFTGRLRRGGSEHAAAGPSQLAPAGPGTAALWARLLTVYVLWGSTYLGIREAIRTIPPFFMGSARFLVAGTVLFLVSSRRGDRRADPLGWRQWRAATLVGGLLLVCGNGGVMWSEQHIPTGTTALLIATVPLWVVVIGFVWFRERVRLRETLGVLIGFGGIALLVSASSTAGGTGASGHFDVVGVPVALFSAACWATGSLYSRRAALPSRPLVSTAMQMLAAGAMLGVLGIATGELGQFHPSRVTLGSVVALAYLIVFGSLVAFSAYVWLLQNARISLIATYAYVNPVVAVFLGWAFLGEPVTPTTALAGLVIVVAVALIVTARRREPAPRPARRGTPERSTADAA